MWDIIIKTTALLATCALRSVRGYTIGITSQDSYAQYTKWNPCTDGSVKFEFKTQQPSGLLLYADDGGRFDFVEVKLTEGELHLRFNLGEGEATAITLGNNLNDDKWHMVTVERQNGALQLTLDAEKIAKSVSNDKPQFGELEGNSYLYVGGLPTRFKGDLRSLALPSVAFEPRFAGSIRNLLYSNCSQNIGTPLLLDSVGLEVDTINPCTENNPCQNNGTCLATDTGSSCDCSNVNFEGEFCEKASLRSFTVLVTTPNPTSSGSVTEARQLNEVTTKASGTNGASSLIGHLHYCILLVVITWTQNTEILF